MENSTRHIARVKPQLASILLREIRRSAVFSEAPPFDLVERVCNISGSPDSFPCPERTGTLVTSRKRKVYNAYNTRTSQFFTGDLSSQSLRA